jgi:glutamate/tyrosine decarboxylase-like PLP-dependent enzyme
MRAIGYRVIDILVDHFRDLPEKPLGRKGTRLEMEKRLWEPLPVHGSSAYDVLDQLEEDVFGHIMHADHPRFFAFVPGPSNYLGAMADALASGFNVFAATWLEASGPTQVELVTVDWLRRACGLPEGAGGLFVSGGSMANITALAVARQRKLGERFERGVIYCSDQTHSSVERGLRVLGFRDEQLRRLACDDDFRIHLPALRNAVEADRAAGLHPFCVVANAGTTNTGAIDPLPQLADYCRGEDLWLHVDGAYGAAAALCERGRELLAGLGRADSLALDPHKWLFQPFEIGCVLMRDMNWLREALQIRPEYLADIEGLAGEINLCDYGIQLTRRFRALKLWMTIKVMGGAAIEKALERGFQLAEATEAMVRRLEGWEVVTPAQLGIVNFRYAGRGLTEEKLNWLNGELVDAMIANQFAMISSTVLRGQRVLRMCTINPRTTGADIHGTLSRLDRMGKELLS